MSPRFNIVTIIGVGLLGGSLGLALKTRGLVNTVRGVGHRQSSLDKALEVGAIDEAFMDAAEASRDADLVVICTPATLVPRKLDEILPVCSQSTVATDVASTKADICAHARATWPSPLRFVGSHPMAGSEKYGPEFATPDLYADSTTLVEPPSDDLDPRAYETICQLWQSVGSQVVPIEPPLHDALLARTSHIPHILAACIAQLADSRFAGDADLKETLSAFTGGGFRDMTRIAAGRPEIWRDICLTNKAALLESLLQLSNQLGDVADMLSEDSAEALEAFFRAGQEARRKVLDV